MNVLALTIFVSSILAAMFALLWITAACTPHSFSDRDSLLPLDDDAPAEPPSAPDQPS